MYACQTCGSVCKIERTIKVSTTPVKFCPTCGGTKLELTKSSFGALTVKAYAGIDRQLVELLYQIWMADKDGEQAAYPMFVDYTIQTIADYVEAEDPE